MPTDVVEQLETQVIGNRFLLWNKQKQMSEYFKSVLDNPKPKQNNFKTVKDITKDLSLVDSLVDLLDMDDLELESIDTTVTSDAISALMKNEVKMPLSMYKYTHDDEIVLQVVHSYFEHGYPLSHIPQL